VPRPAHTRQGSNLLTRFGGTWSCSERAVQNGELGRSGRRSTSDERFQDQGAPKTLPSSSRACRLAFNEGTKSFALLSVSFGGAPLPGVQPRATFHRPPCYQEGQKLRYKWHGSIANRRVDRRIAQFPLGREYLPRLKNQLRPSLFARC
jgi:hypothetical protein